MSLHAQRRAFLMAFRKHGGNIEAASAETGIDAELHAQWQQDWLYRGALAETKAEIEREKAGLPPLEPPAPKRPPGRPRKPEPVDPPPKRPRGRPRKALPPPAEAEAPTTPTGSPDEPAPQIAPDLPSEPPQSPAEPLPEVGTVIPSKHGYTRLYVPDEELPAAPEPEPKAPRKAPEPAPEPSLDLTFASNPEQRALIDEFGELDRRMKVRAMDQARYESLKKAIKNWFSAIPPDADGVIEGDTYLLHLSACERERKIADVARLVEAVGLEKVLEIADIPLGRVEQVLGKSHVDALTVEARTGSRRIKAIPKRPAVVA